MKTISIYRIIEKLEHLSGHRCVLVLLEDSLEGRAIQCCKILSAVRWDNNNVGQLSTNAMLKISRKNLKIRRFGLSVLILLFVIFLVHPGRFSVISVSSVSQKMIEDARLNFATSKHQQDSDDILLSNNPLLNKIQQDIKILGKVANIALPGVVCNPGGSCHPDTSVRLPRVTMVVPFRDREEQLAVFLPYMHNFLQRQGLNYTIVVVNQLSKSKFNRAKLLNIGYDQVMRRCPECSCFIFHDVDLIPINSENLYACLEKPRHM